jgi:predicted CXXCH cytochrome family protein
MEAISYRYQHSVVKDKCPLCHINPEKKENVKACLNFPTMQKERIIYVDELSEDQKYQAEVILTDSTGKSCAPSIIDIIPEELWQPSETRSSLKLKKLSRVTVDEIKKRGFVQATISWETDVFATSEIEYRSRGTRGKTFKIKNLYTKEHKIILNGLKHKKKYYFRVVSRDIYGNTQESKEYTLNTSEEFFRINESIINDSILPAVEHLQAFRGQNKGLYLKISANKPCEISVKLKEIIEEDEKHGFGLLPARYSRIDICYKCHPHDSSHPVGVKAISPKIRTPEGLPTIEDGIITCVTCHKPHGGERVHYNRFDFKKDLCMRCHLQKYGR